MLALQENSLSGLAPTQNPFVFPQPAGLMALLSPTLMPVGLVSWSDSVIKELKNPFESLFSVLLVFSLILTINIKYFLKKVKPGMG